MDQGIYIYRYIYIHMYMCLYIYIHIHYKHIYLFIVQLQISMGGQNVSVWMIIAINMYILCTLHMAICTMPNSFMNNFELFHEIFLFF